MMHRWQDDGMRTIIDLPDDLHKQAISIARDTSRSLSETVADLMRRALGQTGAAEVSRSSRTGLPVVRLGTVITTEDVQSLENDDQ
jgi:Arc/MetJ family transcription regulator